MKSYKSIFVLFFALTLFLIPVKNTFSGSGTSAFRSTIGDTDSHSIGDRPLLAYFDLRNRESFVQITNVDDEVVTLHIQIFNVDQDCNENNFFDNYTVNDTHIYNMRDILTNDGDPSGVVLPENAYGFVALIPFGSNGELIGNFRIIDEIGYEYRTNLQSPASTTSSSGSTVFFSNYHFNFNQSAGITFSDIVGITYDNGQGEVFASNPTDAFQLLDIDIVNNNEVIFSCRNVIFACIDEDNPRQEELLEFVSDNTEGSASVASFEYGINEAIPHSKSGELLCPGNNITEGIVNLNQISLNSTSFSARFHAYVGLNNGNGRGSMDSIFSDNLCLAFPLLCD